MGQTIKKKRYWRKKSTSKSIPAAQPEKEKKTGLIEKIKKFFGGA